MYHKSKNINGFFLFALLLLSFLFIVLSPTKTFAASVSDDFNRADGSLGSNWTDFTSGGLTISSNAVVGTNGAGGNSGDSWSANTFTSDQYSQIEVSSTQLAGTQWIGPAVRMQNSGQDGYVGIYYWNNGSPELMLFRETSGGWTQLGSSYSISALSAGTQLKVTAVGSTISMLENGTKVITATDSSYTGGAPGIMAFQSPTVDNWTGGDITYSVEGHVSGLSGTVVLQHNGGDNLSVSSSGSFIFNTQLTLGSTYNVTVQSNPTGQTCAVSNGSGTVSSADVTNISVNCSTTSASDDFNRTDGALGSKWTDISDGGLAISSNAVVGTNGTGGLSGNSWNANTFTNDQFSQIEVTSTQLAGTQWIGPAVRMQSSGQDGYVGIYYWNNGSPELMLFKRDTGGWSQLGSSYSVSPLSAGTQLKVTAVGSTISMYENNTVVITATDSTYTGGAPGIMAFQSPHADNWSGGSIRGTYSISGTVSGLSGTIVLQNNNSDDKSISSNGSFTFDTLLSEGEAYNVTVQSNPTGQTCTVSNDSGTISGANITNVSVNCTATLSAKSDSFDRSDGALGSKWADISDGGLTISSDVVTGGNSGVSGDSWRANTFGDDQYSRVQVNATLSGGNWIGPAVRVQNNGSEAYVGIYNWNFGSPELQVFKRNGGSWAQLGSSYSVSALSVGTQLEIDAVGSTISMLENGETVISATDSSYTGGAPGIMAAGTSGSIDNWVGGDKGAMSCVTAEVPHGACGPYTNYPKITGANSDPTIDQNIWGSGGTNYMQTLYANNPSDWYIMGSVSNNSSGAILTYPNTGFNMTGTVDGYSSTTSSFSTTFPHNASTDAWAAYDLWFNDWADEVMIQTDISANSNYNCTAVATATFNGDPWHLCVFGSERVWKHGSDDAHLINQSSGTIDIKAMLVWMENNGYLPTSSTWTAGSFGFEVANTTGLNEKFQVNDFSFTAN